MGDIEPGTPPVPNAPADPPEPVAVPASTEPAGGPGSTGPIGAQAASPTIPIPATPDWQPPATPAQGQAPYGHPPQDPPPAWEPPYGQGPQGLPPPWQPPPAQPPYGQGPQGQPPPWQPPYWGPPGAYGPAYPPPPYGVQQPPYAYPPGQPPYWAPPPGPFGPGQGAYGPDQPLPAASEPPKPPPTAAQKRASVLRVLLAAGLAIALIFILSDALGAFRGAQSVRVPAGTDSGLQRAALAPAAGTAPALDIRAALRAVEPGVVDITTSGRSGLAQNESQGTGMVLDARGDVLTNAHVVAGTGGITVQIFGDPAVYKATVLGADKTADVAVVKIQNPPKLTPVPLGRSSGIRVGDPVAAVGNALGLTPGGPTVTSGIIAGLDRTLDTSAGNSAPEHLTGLIQTDAALNPGNSGGPLIDAQNQVIGMNTAIASSPNPGSAQDIGFSIPIDVAMQLVPSLEKGVVPASNQGFLGVDIEDVATGGAKVIAVTPHSPAAAAGLKPGDVITALNGQSVATSGDAAGVIGALGPGAKLSITFSRGSTTHKVTVTLATRPATISPPTISP